MNASLLDDAKRTRKDNSGDKDAMRVDRQGPYEVLEKRGEELHVVAIVGNETRVPLTGQPLRIHDEDALAIGQRIPVIAQLDAGGVAGRAVQHHHERCRDSLVKRAWGVQPVRARYSARSQRCENR